MLSGIMQNQLIEIAQKANIKCKAVNGLSLNNLENIDVCVLCNSVQGFRIIDKINCLHHDVQYSISGSKACDLIIKELLDSLN